MTASPRESAVAPFRRGWRERASRMTSALRRRAATPCCDPWLGERALRSASAAAAALGRSMSAESAHSCARSAVAAYEAAWSSRSGKSSIDTPSPSASARAAAAPNSEHAAPTEAACDDSRGENKAQRSNSEGVCTSRCAKCAPHIPCSPGPRPPLSLLTERKKRT
eukprot:scaffold324374_cov61-Tisochrysis_lutea.AAC.3